MEGVASALRCNSTTSPFCIPKSLNTTISRAEIRFSGPPRLSLSSHCCRYGSSQISPFHFSKISSRNEGDNILLATPEAGVSTETSEWAMQGEVLML